MDVTFFMLFLIKREQMKLIRNLKEADNIMSNFFLYPLFIKDTNGDKSSKMY